MSTELTRVENVERRSDWTRARQFEAMFKAESSFVWHSLRRLGIARSDLEDLTHEVFLTVHRRLGDYDSSRPIRPWLFGITYRTAMRYRDLARHRHEVAGDLPDTADHSHRADDQLINHEAQHLLNRAIDSLDLSVANNIPARWLEASASSLGKSKPASKPIRPRKKNV